MAGDCHISDNDGGEGKMKTSKHQAPSSREAPRTKLQYPRRAAFGVWSLMFLWSLVLGIWCFSFSSSADPIVKPNIVLILADDQGYGDLSVHGNPWVKTPNIDRLATNGIRFDRFFVSPLCAPTRASLLIGRYSLRTGVR